MKCNWKHKHAFIYFIMESEKTADVFKSNVCIRCMYTSTHIHTYTKIKKFQSLISFSIRMFLAKNDCISRSYLKQRENWIVKRRTTTFIFEHQIFQADKFKCLLYFNMHRNHEAWYHGRETMNSTMNSRFKCIQYMQLFIEIIKQYLDIWSEKVTLINLFRLRNL